MGPPTFSLAARIGDRLAVAVAAVVLSPFILADYISRVREEKEFRHRIREREKQRRAV
jgi:hypothetical protein